MDINAVEKEAVFRGPVTVVYQPRIVRPLCASAYYKHAKGCPNLRIKPGCPPHAALFLDIFESEVYVAAIKFDLRAYVEKKECEHPDWTPRALENPRHWQGHVRAILKDLCQEKCKDFPGYVSITNAEAMGVNLTETCRNVGIILEWPPRRVVYQVSLLAKSKKV
ncbi:MAG: hypothetical protein UU64_C0004G0038 [candidate division WWE3 bacterium GW2011_GWF2_41_45]|nr:MAG: hypothetical protein UU55_C0007G0024 [candidate division WWE3 bacterium GW2011_GWC2_41_23]KKS10441.1 MAG: hypothetical protein UU64_C0004G0038 [candidate division WWE3 bacterium GW2011_GWF2_41_45]KKS20090.1 MAG: hypothetical protein UU79_C0004G0037 [candidate division WWE3 bacterium GW2011_GWE1_41_72]KKS26857.1 MAG: hypothetical protein UU86_C0029G0010 [candidate division WWE3 bacterium GW2011_GWC1_42_102]KKS50702.1 MAG: hypothetical protein UV16_C0007G0070 [candidate division WWE3 bact